MFLYSTVSTLKPIVGIVVTISPSLLKVSSGRRARSGYSAALQLVQNGCFAGSIKTNHKNSHLLLPQEPVKQLRNRETHDGGVLRRRALWKSYVHRILLANARRNSFECPNENSLEGNWTNAAWNKDVAGADDKLPQQISGWWGCKDQRKQDLRHSARWSAWNSTSRRNDEVVFGALPCVV